ncbi:MAG: hypothetical protein ACRC33_27875 [Gemmataceae bacterium]
MDRLLTDGFEVTAMFWVKTADEGLWHLYVVIPRFSTDKLADTYRAVYASLSKIPDPVVSLSEIKVISPDNPIARDVFDILRKYPGRMPTVSRRPRLGEMAVTETYVYPEPRQTARRISGVDLGRVRLKGDVEQTQPLEVLLAPLSGEDEADYKRLTASGLPPQHAELLVRQRRQSLFRRPPILAGSVVKAMVKAWWGDTPDDDPNPLLLVEDDAGAQGLTHKENTEPVS